MPVAKVKLVHPNAKMPEKANPSDAGFDVTVVEGPKINWVYNNNGKFYAQYVEYKTGLKVQPEIGYHIDIYPRGSISKYDLILANSIGLGDNGFTGEYCLRFRTTRPIFKDHINSGMTDEEALNLFNINYYKPGDKACQFVFKKDEDVKLELVEELNSTDRNEGKFGSTGV